MRPSFSIRSASLRTRVALAAAAAAAAVVAVFTILTSLVLANNDAAQLDRRLDSIVDASMYPDQLSDPRRGVLTTGRMRNTGQVVFQRGLQLPRLDPGTSTVEVNGIEYRVRTIPVEREVRPAGKSAYSEWARLRLAYHGLSAAWKLKRRR